MRGQEEPNAPELTSCPCPQLLYPTGPLSAKGPSFPHVEIPLSVHSQTDAATSSCPPERGRRDLGSGGANSRVQLSPHRSPADRSHPYGPSALHEKEPSWDGGGGEPLGTRSAIDSRNGRLGRG